MKLFPRFRPFLALFILVSQASPNVALASSELEKFCKRWPDVCTIFSDRISDLNNVITDLWLAIYRPGNFELHQYFEPYNELEIYDFFEEYFNSWGENFVKGTFLSDNPEVFGNRRLAPTFLRWTAEQWKQVRFFLDTDRQRSSSVNRSLRLGFAAYLVAAPEKANENLKVIARVTSSFGQLEPFFASLSRADWEALAQYQGTEAINRWSEEYVEYLASQKRAPPKHNLKTLYRNGYYPVSHLKRGEKDAIFYADYHNDFGKRVVGLFEPNVGAPILFSGTMKQTPDLGKLEPFVMKIDAGKNGILTFDRSEGMLRYLFVQDDLIPETSEKTFMEAVRSSIDHYSDDLFSDSCNDSFHTQTGDEGLHI